VSAFCPTNLRDADRPCDLPVGHGDPESYGKIVNLKKRCDA
jgi:hypothetical protein